MSAKKSPALRPAPRTEPAVFVQANFTTEKSSLAVCLCLCLSLRLSISLTSFDTLSWFMKSHTPSDATTKVDAACRKRTWHGQTANGNGNE